MPSLTRHCSRWAEAQYPSSEFDDEEVDEDERVWPISNTPRLAVLPPKDEPPKLEG